ncbi:MAG TPA: hypothetical protein VFF06_11830 [Polyangia bacterium]|nr:hypothetical protein [Polyangia bacterium]
MSAKKPPVTRTKEEHGSKEKLVDRLVTLLAQITKSDESKDDLKGRLLAASNKKLLRLDEIAHAIKEKFGSVEKLAAETAQALGRAKDAPYVDKLKAMTPARLLDLFRASEKRAKKSAKKSKAA